MESRSFNLRATSKIFQLDPKQKNMNKYSLGLVQSMANLDQSKKEICVRDLILNDITIYGIILDIIASNNE